MLVKQKVNKTVRIKLLDRHKLHSDYCEEIKVKEKRPGMAQMNKNLSSKHRI